MGNHTTATESTSSKVYEEGEEEPETVTESHFLREKNLNQTFGALHFAFLQDFNSSRSDQFGFPMVIIRESSPRLVMRILCLTSDRSPQKTDTERMHGSPRMHSKPVTKSFLEYFTEDIW